MKFRFAYATLSTRMRQEQMRTQTSLAVAVRKAKTARVLPEYFNMLRVVLFIKVDLRYRLEEVIRIFEYLGQKEAKVNIVGRAHHNWEVTIACVAVKVFEYGAVADGTHLTEEPMIALP